MVDCLVDQLVASKEYFGAGLLVAYLVDQMAFVTVES